MKFCLSLIHLFKIFLKILLIFIIFMDFFSSHLTGILTNMIWLTRHPDEHLETIHAQIVNLYQAVLSWLKYEEWMHHIFQCDLSGYLYICFFKKTDLSLAIGDVNKIFSYKLLSIIQLVWSTYKLCVCLFIWGTIQWSDKGLSYQNPTEVKQTNQKGYLCWTITF